MTRDHRIDRTIEEKKMRAWIYNCSVPSDPPVLFLRCCNLDNMADPAARLGTVHGTGIVGAPPWWNAAATPGNPVAEALLSNGYDDDDLPIMLSSELSLRRPSNRAAVIGCKPLGDCGGSWASLSAAPCRSSICPTLMCGKTFEVCCWLNEKSGRNRFVGDAGTKSDIMDSPWRSWRWFFPPSTRIVCLSNIRCGEVRDVGVSVIIGGALCRRLWIDEVGLFVRRRSSAVSGELWPESLHGVLDFSAGWTVQSINKKIGKQNNRLKLKRYSISCYFREGFIFANFASQTLVKISTSIYAYL